MRIPFGVGLLLALLSSVGAPTTTAQTSSPDTLSLEAAVQEALTANYDVQVARNDATIAENNVTRGNAGYLPRATANGRASQSVANSTVEFGGTEQSDSGVVSTRYNAGAEARWTLFDGFRRGATYDRLKAERDRQQSATREQVELVVADVVVAYSDVARLQQQVDVFDEAVGISEERLRIARLRKDLGSASDLEVRQAVVDLNTDRADRLRARADLITARAQLARLLGRTVTEGPPVSPTVDLNQDLQEERLRDIAAEQSPALRQADQAVRAAREEVAEVQSDWFPSLDLFGGYSYSRTENGAGAFQFNEVSQFEYGAALAFTIFDGFERQRRVENARVRVQTARYLRSDAEARLSAEITGAFERYGNRVAVVDLERENVSAASANVDVALERFRLGTITSVELREVQQQQIRAESRLLDARFEAKRAETELLRLTGQLVD
ncbi:TolC family protein [Longibacter sp.]|uniref:TolC family protein n=1 Tax=Longibacter sp. TaxID=2045415 RepID=UPI003EBE0EDB